MKKFIFLIGLLLLFFSRLSAQGLYQEGILYVKFKDDSDIELKGDRLDFPITNDNKILESGKWSKIYDAPKDRLQSLRQIAQENLRQTLPDPNSEFFFMIPENSDLEGIIVNLAQLNMVEQVLKVPISKTPLPPSFENKQVYLNGADAGINAKSVWEKYNIKGQGIKIVDIEYEFNSNHQDLPPVIVLGANPPLPRGNNEDSQDDKNHGTAVLGEIASLNNNFGTTGIAFESQFYFAGTMRIWNNMVIYDISNAISLALNVLNPGDIILIEQQIFGPNDDPNDSPESQFGCVPVEWYKPWYNAIKLAVGNGLIVVEAAGNGQQNLDDPIYSQGNNGHWPFLPQNNSGAIMVGAGAPFGGDYGVARSRLSFSDYGSRVDLQGYGAGVTTTGYGPLYNAEGENLFYTSFFSGTSSASPIVTGAVALLQSYYKTKFGKVLNSSQILDILVKTGLPQTDGQFPASQKIGPLPQAAAAIDKSFCLLSDCENCGFTFDCNTICGNVPCQYDFNCTGLNFIMNKGKVEPEPVDKLNQQKKSDEFAFENTAKERPFLTLSPNPFASELRLQINLERQEIVSVFLRDINGIVRLKGTENLSQPQGIYNITLNTSSLPPGIYLLEVITGSKKEVKKVIKQ